MPVHREVRVGLKELTLDGRSTVAHHNQGHLVVRIHGVSRAQAGEHVPAKGALQGMPVQLAEHRSGVPLLGEQHFQASGIDRGGIQPAGTQCSEDAVHHQGGGRGEQQDVVACIQGRDLPGARWNRFGHTGHGQGIGEDQSLKPQRVEEKVTDDAWR